jgi:hypothetical protein
MSSEQAGFLFDEVKEREPVIIAKRSYGYWDGLLRSLSQIDRGGGALLRNCATALNYGGDVIGAAIIPASTYIAWPGIKTVPGPFWDLAMMLPELSIEHQGQRIVWKPVTFYRATSPLAIVPLAAVVLPGQNPFDLIAPLP